MLKNLIILLIITVSFFISIVQADEKKDLEENSVSAVQGGVQLQTQQEIIDEFKTFASSIPEDVRSEVVEFRKEIASINKKKREAYKKLSNAAQNYLLKEQEYKKRLPLKDKSRINLANPGEKNPKDKNDKTSKEASDQ